MRTICILTGMFFVLFLINLAALFGVNYTHQSARVIFISRLAVALTMNAWVMCLIVAIALDLGVA